MAELAEVVTETVAAAAENVSAEAQAVADISRSLAARELSIGFVLGSSVSGLVSFFVLRKVLEKRYNKQVEEEIDTMREHFRKRADLRETQRAAAAVAAGSDKPDLQIIVEERGYVPPPPGGLNTAPLAAPKVSERTWEEIRERLENKTDEDEEVVIEGWNFAEELASRTPDKPYILHESEFKERDFPTVSLTYYEGDDVLCDEANMPVDNKHRLVGEDNLSKFGHGSGNPYVLYIRNEVLNIDMEVLRVEKSFIDEIRSLRHSDKRMRRLRFDDEA